MAPTTFSREGLMAFLREQQTRPHGFGRDDCGTLLMDWMWATTGQDPCPDWRGVYATHGEAVQRSGPLGLSVQVWRLARKAGCRLGRKAELGDLGMFMAEDRPGRVMFGISSGEGWATRDSGISHFKNTRTLIVWKHPFNHSPKEAPTCCVP